MFGFELVLIVSFLSEHEFEPSLTPSYNDDALDHFRGAHDILDNVRIERSRPNEDAKIVEGNENRILVRIWLVHQAGLHFFISPLLKEVMARSQSSGPCLRSTR